MKWILLSLLVLSTLAFSQNKKETKKVDDPIVAEVNGKKIKKSSLYRYHLNNLKFVKGNKKVTLDSSLNDLMNRIVGIDKAKKNNLHKNPIVIKKMNDIVYHAQISRDLEPELKKIKVSDAEVKAYYAKNPEYRTAQILYRLRANPSAEDTKKAQEQSNIIYNQLQKKPDSFMQVAKKFSQTANAPTIGGDLGYQPRTKLTPEYYEAILGKANGFITKPFRSQYGWHIAKVLGKKTYAQITKELYKKIIYDKKRDEIFDKYYAKERSKAKIKVYSKNLK
jgi:peptidyl-prolyl cis-trans isomerase C